MLPTFLTLILLALQPVCLLYTRAVMESAAAETARLMTTTTAEDDDLKEFTRRRLAAVPNVSIFHAGGQRVGFPLIFAGFQRGGNEDRKSVV